MSDKIVLLDGHSILNRAFYGVPDLSNAEGLHTNAVYGFLNILFKILDEEQPQYLAVAFDLHAPTFRHKMYDQYKGTRKPMPQEKRIFVPAVSRFFLFFLHIAFQKSCQIVGIGRVILEICHRTVHNKICLQFLVACMAFPDMGNKRFHLFLRHISLHVWLY